MPLAWPVVSIQLPQPGSSAATTSTSRPSSSSRAVCLLTVMRLFQSMDSIHQLSSWKFQYGQSGTAVSMTQAWPGCSVQ